MKIAGLKVVDATKPLRIKITPLDVRLGDTKDPGGCAAARCLKRSVPECTQARVHLGRTYLKEGDKWLRYQTTQALRAEIVAFDRGGKFEPGDYMLSPITPSQRLSRGKQHGTATGQSKPKRAKIARIRHVTTGVRQHGANR